MATSSVSTDIGFGPNSSGFGNSVAQGQAASVPQGTPWALIAVGAVAALALLVLVLRPKKKKAGK